MNRGNARPIESIQWQPQERLGQLSMDAQLRPWLIGKGLLTLRLREACGARFALRLVDQWTGLLSASHKAALRTEDNAGLFRDVEMCRGDSVWVFGQTIVPDSTLCVHPWLAELGDSALGETLADLSGVERSPYEYAWLPTEEAVTARAPMVRNSDRLGRSGGAHKAGEEQDGQDVREGLDEGHRHLAHDRDAEDELHEQTQLDEKQLELRAALKIEVGALAVALAKEKLLLSRLALIPRQLQRRESKKGVPALV